MFTSTIYLLVRARPNFERIARSDLLDNGRMRPLELTATAAPEEKHVVLIMSGWKGAGPTDHLKPKRIFCQTGTKTIGLPRHHGRWLFLV